jgi:uncharacterized protein YxeA
VGVITIMKKFVKIVVCTIIIIATIVVVGIDFFKNKLYIPKNNLWNESETDAQEETEETEPNKIMNYNI